ncbi:MAG TPA: hypothetical protein VGR53_00065 [Nitrososphaerales archaeon]|nr:hypothetical protein [Nitrososphaerales archaeon]
MSVRWVALAGAIATVLGFLLVFLPIFQNPALWGTPTTVPAPDYELFGLFLFIVGSVALLSSFAAFLWRSGRMRTNRAKTIAVYKMSYKLVLAGALAYALARAAIHLAFPNPPPPFKLGPLFDVSLTFPSLIVGYVVAYSLVRYYDRIPFSNPIAKSVALSTIALLIFAVLSTLVARGNSFYFMVYIVYEAAIYTATGLVVGLGFVRIYGRQSPPVAEVTRGLKRTWPYYLAIFGITILFVVYTQYQDSLQPVSFKVSGIHFSVNNRAVQLNANVTNTSKPSIIQVDAAIDGLDFGVCGYGIDANQTKVCDFQIIPLLSCSQIPQIANHTLTLSPYFENGRKPTNTYQIANAQLGCA